ncbi:MAG: trypsin-like peptidase domain-containing protein, partial [Bradyrhizobium sp.]
MQENRPVIRKFLSTRRLALLSSVAILGSAMMLMGPVGHARLAEPAWAATETTQQGPAGFANLVAKVRPAVISVRVKMEENTDDGDGGVFSDNPFKGTPFEKFFHQYGFDGGPKLHHHEIITGVGSGFFISPDGYAVTNNHVVDKAESVKIITDDGQTHEAKVIGTDPRTDLALIKVEGGPFPYVKLSDKTPRIGDWVLAVGNPFGLGGTVTAGIVSARGRDINSSPYDDFIQIDAPVNKGNSGGPTFDTEGNVIGVNTAIYSPSGGSVGIAFAIPADTVKSV